MLHIKHKKAMLFYSYSNSGYTITVQDASGTIERFYNCGIDYAAAQFKKLHGIRKKALLIRY